MKVKKLVEGISGKKKELYLKKFLLKIGGLDVGFF